MRLDRTRRSRRARRCTFKADGAQYPGEVVGVDRQQMSQPPDNLLGSYDITV